MLLLVAHSVGYATQWLVSDENFTRVGPDPSIRFSTRIYMETTLAGVRIEDAGIVLIDHTN
jgi:hypothetical protein